MSKISGITTLSFDVDGTLVDFDKVMHESLQITLDELAKSAPDAAAYLDIPTMIEIRNKVSEELKHSATIEEIRLEAFKRTLAIAGKPDDKLASHLTELYMKHRYGDIEIFPDVLPAVYSLKDKYTLGVITNGNSYPEKCGLDGIFYFGVFSQEHGVEKPDLKLFRVGLEKAGCSPDRFLHVGDSLSNDIEPANRMGIRCVWLNRNHQENISGIKVDHEIVSLAELVDLLE
jgi:putative hydrolase of the HAD superfamily